MNFLFTNSSRPKYFALSPGLLCDMASQDLLLVWQEAAIENCRAQSMVQFCIQSKASALAKTRLSPVFSIETQAIRTKELISESFCQGFDDSVNFVTDLRAVPEPVV